MRQRSARWLLDHYSGQDPYLGIRSFVLIYLTSIVKQILTAYTGQCRCLIRGGIHGYYVRSQEGSGVLVVLSA